MSKYDDLFAATAPDDSVFADKGALDPLAEPDEVVAREDQEAALATILNGVHQGYLPTTLSVYGPPGTGKTLTTRRVCREFAARHADLAVEYVNLKECRTLFSAANELLFALTGTKEGAYEGLDGVFTAIWDALAEYPEWTVLILDEIDHLQYDTNYDPNEFFYRLLRGEGKLERDIQLSAWLVSNELLEVDLRLDSRVQSAMSGEELFFPPYGADELATVLAPRVERAFRDGALSDDVFEHGVQQAARRWGDARRALTLFRHAGETATERDRAQVTRSCLDDNIEATERTAVLAKLRQLPDRHREVLLAMTGWEDDGAIVQPVTTDQMTEEYSRRTGTDLTQRAVRNVTTDLETMGLVETWTESHDRGGTVMYLETTFDPERLYHSTHGGSSSQ